MRLRNNLKYEQEQDQLVKLWKENRSNMSSISFDEGEQLYKWKGIHGQLRTYQYNLEGQ